MDMKELKCDPTLQDFFDTMGHKENTMQNYLKAFRLYTDYTGKNISQILNDAPYGYSDDRIQREGQLKGDLVGFRRHLIGLGMSPLTVKNTQATILSFMREHDVSIPRLPRNRGKVRALEHNTSIPNVEQLRKLLKVCNPLEKAIVLVGLSSGLSASDIIHLTVGQFQEGYDKETGVTTFQMRRKKTDVPFITFLTPEASQAVLDYIEYRNRPTTRCNTVSSTHIEKQKIRSDKDKLFVKYNISDKYLEKLDDRQRMFGAHSFLTMFNRISSKAGLSSEGDKWNVIRSHNMRRWFNSQLLNSGADSFFVEYIMGHQLDDVRGAYFRPSPERLKDIYLKYVPALTIQESFDVESSEQYKEVVAQNEMLEATNVRANRSYDMTLHMIDDLKKQIAVEQAKREEADRQREDAEKQREEVTRNFIREIIEKQVEKYGNVKKDENTT